MVSQGAKRPVKDPAPVSGTGSGTLVAVRNTTARDQEDEHCDVKPCSIAAPSRCRSENLTRVVGIEKLAPASFGGG